MLVYWLLFAYFAAGAVFSQARPSASQQGRPMFALGAVIVACLIGFRYKVGADWLTYTFIFDDAGRREFLEALSHGDPGYQALNWVVYHAGGDIWLVNIACAVIFAWGLFRFCRLQPVPWTAVLVAVPYTVIVVAMGYTRQGVALGILMAGLASFMRGGSVLRFAAYVFAAGLFHRTAVVAFPMVALATSRNRAINLMVALAVSVMLYDYFLGDAMDDFVSNYIKAHYSSQGAAIRLAMTMISVGLFWVLGDKLQFNPLEQKLWRNFSFATLILLVLLVVLPSSTAVDRLSLYVLPLQIAVLGRLPIVFRTRLPGVALVASYLFAVQFVWLNFAQHSQFWVPYQFFPF